MLEYYSEFSEGAEGMVCFGCALKVHCGELCMQLWLCQPENKNTSLYQNFGTYEVNNYNFN